MDAAPTAHAHQVGEGVGRSRAKEGALLWLLVTDLPKAARAILGDGLITYGRESNAHLVRSQSGLTIEDDTRQVLL